MTTSIRSGASDGAIQYNGVDVIPFDANGIKGVIPTVTAPMAANAMTVGVASQMLAFRSATLGSGSVSAFIAAPANLVVPSGATLGTVSAVQSQLVVIEMNNAGTAELAVVNIAGGNDLSETGLISTTAITSGATAANVFYSTTARTSLPYRVVGVITSTQATAGTWATPPSTIQGIGGLAGTTLAAISRSWLTVTGSRAVSTTYYNIGTKDKDVSIAVSASISPAYLTITQNGVAVSAAYVQPGTSTISQLYATVPPGASYSLTYAGTITSWTERG